MPSVQLALPVKPVSFEADRVAAIRKFYTKLRGEFLRGAPGGHVMYSPVWAGAQDMYNFSVKTDDIWLLGYPKSGTTWLQEIVWLINHDCDFEKANKTSVLVRVPNLELCFMPAEDTDPNKPLAKAILSLEQQRVMPSPRHFKTHLPFHLLPPGLLDTAKVVYVARNPKDVIVSFYHHHKSVKDYTFDGTVEDFAELFMRDEIPRTPYFGQLLEAWNLRNHPNMLFLFYEDLKSNLRGQIEKLAKFLNKEISEENISKVMEYTSFENCKKKMDFSKVLADSEVTSVKIDFFRKGKTGDWKNHFSPEMSARLDKWIEQNLANTGLLFKMELDRQD